MYLFFECAEDAFIGSRIILSFYGKIILKGSCIIMRNITNESIMLFQAHLPDEEKSKATLEKYLRDVRGFFEWLGDSFLDKSRVLEYKKYLSERYAVASVNSIISSLNSFFSYHEWYELRIKTIKVQRQIFSESERELSKMESGEVHRQQIQNLGLLSGI